MSTVAEWARQIRRLRPHLPERLTPELDASIKRRLRPWWQRIAEARALHAEGAIEAPRGFGARTAAYEHVRLEPDEAEAALDLLVVTAHLVARIVAATAPRGASSRQMRDQLDCVWEPFTRCLSSYRLDAPGGDHDVDFSRATEGSMLLSSYLHLDFANEAKAAWRRTLKLEPSDFEVEMHPDAELADDDAFDALTLLDLDAWALDFVRDTELEPLYLELRCAHNR